ncbi:DUF2784 domain-containing protein [Parahaliea aestuarii]|uniref:DUF2784 domain-containing protein n=1 Tax=Parahaliea aestuarii TaxID=1852021 RepID=A0A5C9A1E1_9GAMM|nr:DUF2784 domain-containing protein [Parahaliea aestuarii]TXS94673.1 DUF2784 domain-containing protein [Parahaliea aestuarii]
MLYRVAADLVLLVHVLFVLFVVLGLALVLLGGLRKWEWVRNPWFRLAHLAAIGVVVLQAWLGQLCPLTHLEVALRQQAGDAAYTGAFIAHYLERVLYFQAPQWVFVAAYTLFALLVVAAWYGVRPRALQRGQRRAD